MVTIVDGVDLISEPVTISVGARPKRAQEAILEAASAIKLCLRRSGSVESDDLAQALEARELLGSSEATRAITEAQILRALQNAGAARARAFAMDDVKKHRAELAPVAREYFDLLTVEVLLDRKEYDDAKKLLDGFKQDSSQRSSVLGRFLSETKKK